MHTYRVIFMVVVYTSPLTLAILCGVSYHMAMRRRMRESKAATQRLIARYGTHAHTPMHDVVPMGEGTRTNTHHVRVYDHRTGRTTTHYVP